MNNIQSDIVQSKQTTTTVSTPPATTSAPKSSGRFGRVLGGILGGAANIVAPGASAMISGFLRGGTGIGMDTSNLESLMAQSAQQQMSMITLQNRVQTNSQEFSTISNLMKSRHDGEMSAIQNIKS